MRFSLDCPDLAFCILYLSMHSLIQLIIFQPLYNILAALCILFKGNLGGAVLVLSIGLRLVIWPWYKSAMRDQRKLAKLQPKIKSLQKQFKADPLQANKAVMKLFQEEKINPFSSFLFVFVQLTIFVILYVFFVQALKTDWNSFLYPFISYIPHLNYSFLSFDLRQPSFFLTLISALLNSLMTFVQPSTGQNEILLFSLPFIILLFYQKFPAIIILYWIGITLVGIVQEFLMAKEGRKVSGNDNFKNNK